ncbi:hypothetical protein AXG93_684s1000 [Marchantia polymorpha subsp. ruderalis]|uniref:Uncharacterized protein n=1 Tax=Marchantia polymorpha subsp. ruderalis TaxID=1480154 RepID=A0A176W8U3_MARPO|nr:hypothetical protein AXG93_684s1000 [Marchantia polymorpha subsp. ruderalis]
MSDYNDVFGNDDTPPWLTASKESEPEDLEHGNHGLIFGVPIQLGDFWHHHKITSIENSMTSTTARVRSVYPVRRVFRSGKMKAERKHRS